MKEPTMRGYQDDCIKGLRNAITTGNRKCLAILPTGSGKTTIFGKITKGFLDRHPNERAAIISHLGLLTAQTGDRFRDEWGLESGVLQANRLPAGGDRCVITTMQSFSKRNKLERWSLNAGGFSPSIDRLKITLLVIDEVHRWCKTYEQIEEMFPNALIIGFTATPFKENKLMTNMFDCVAYTISTQELIDMGHLVPPILNEIDFDTTDEADMYAKIIQVYRERHHKQKAVVFLRTIEQCDTLRNIMLQTGIKASAITSKFTGEGRDEALRFFRQGDGADVLITVDVLTAGFDSPNLRAIFMPYKVGSVTTYLQRVGRGLRPDKGKTHCDIYAGSNSPGIEPGFWEKIQRQMLNAGRQPQDYDTLMEILEYAENNISKEQIQWTKEVVRMAEETRKKGMSCLADMIVTKKFPESLMNQFVETPPLKSNAKHVPPTAGQIKYLSGLNLYADGLSKHEASAILTAHGMSTGRTPKSEIVQDGVYAGKHLSQVPHIYWKKVEKQSSMYQQYVAWKRKMRSNR